MARQRKRNYKREYKQRLKRGRELGRTLAESRGHKRKTITAPTFVTPVKKILRPKHRFYPTERESDVSLEELKRAGVEIRELRGIDIHDETSFIQKLLDMGYTPREAYTLRFSP